MVSVMKCVGLMIHRRVPLGQIIHQMLLKKKKKKSHHQLSQVKGEAVCSFTLNNFDTKCWGVGSHTNQFQFSHSLNTNQMSYN